MAALSPDAHNSPSGHFPLKKRVNPENVQTLHTEERMAHGLCYLYICSADISISF